MWSYSHLRIFIHSIIIIYENNRHEVIGLSVKSWMIRWSMGEGVFFSCCWYGRVPSKAVQLFLLNIVRWQEQEWGQILTKVKMIFILSYKESTQSDHLQQHCQWRGMCLQRMCLLIANKGYVVSVHNILKNIFKKLNVIYMLSVATDWTRIFCRNIKLFHSF